MSNRDKMMDSISQSMEDQYRVDMTEQQNISQELALEHMTCYDFSKYLLDRGFDVDIDTHEEILDKLAEIDGDGTSTLVLDEIEVRFHDCFLYYDDDELENKDKNEK